MRIIWTLRVVATLTAAIFTYTEFARAAHVYDLQVPQAIGQVKARYKGQTDAPVVLIQDAHTSLQAQQNISKILTYLSNQYQLNQVALEGAAGPLQVDYFRQFPDHAIRDKVINGMLKEGILSAAEHAAITQPTPMQTYGVEDAQVYRKNREAARTVLMHEQQLVKLHAALNQALGEKSQGLFTKELLAWEEKRAAAASGHMAFADFIKELLQSSGANGFLPDMEQYPSLSFFIEQLKKGSSLDQNAARIDYGRLLEEADDFGLAYALFLAPTPEVKALVWQREDLRVFERLIHLRALPRDLSYFYKRKNAFTRAAWTVLLATSQDPDILSILDIIEDALTQIASFYELADERSRVLLDKTLAMTGQSHGVDSPVLVTGGFHTEEMEALLREQNKSYVVIQPNLTALEENIPYEKLVLGKPGMYERLLAAASSTLHPGYALEPLVSGLNKLQAVEGIFTNAAYKETVMALFKTLSPNEQNSISFSEIIQQAKDVLAGAGYAPTMIIKSMTRDDAVLLAVISNVLVSFDNEDVVPNITLFRDAVKQEYENLNVPMIRSVIEQQLIKQEELLTSILDGFFARQKAQKIVSLPEFSIEGADILQRLKEVVAHGIATWRAAYSRLLQESMRYSFGFATTMLFFIFQGYGDDSRAYAEIMKSDDPFVPAGAIWLLVFIAGTFGIVIIRSIYRAMNAVHSSAVDKQHRGADQKYRRIQGGYNIGNDPGHRHAGRNFKQVAHPTNHKWISVNNAPSVIKEAKFVRKQMIKINDGKIKTRVIRDADVTYGNYYLLVRDADNNYWYETYEGVKLYAEFRETDGRQARVNYTYGAFDFFGVAVFLGMLAKAFLGPVYQDLAIFAIQLALAGLVIMRLYTLIQPKRAPNMTIDLTATPASEQTLIIPLSALFALRNEEGRLIVSANEMQNLPTILLCDALQSSLKTLLDRGIKVVVYTGDHATERVQGLLQELQMELPAGIRLMDNRSSALAEFSSAMDSSKWHLVAGGQVVSVAKELRSLEDFTEGIARVVKQLVGQSLGQAISEEKTASEVDLTRGVLSAA